MFKRFFSLTLSIVLGLFSCIMPIHALENVQEKTINLSSDCQLITVITNQAELQNIIETQQLNVPTGYHLEKVEIYRYTDADEEQIASTLESTIQPYALLYTIKNVRHSPNEFYYVNEYDSDWFYGPCSVSETYTRESTVKIDIDTTIGNGTVSAAVGYSITDTYVKSKTFTTTVAANKKLNVRIHTNYKSTQFDIYNQWSNNLVEKDAWTAKPIGLVFVQYTYSL